jgi:hypothetical protein
MSTNYSKTVFLFVFLLVVIGVGNAQHIAYVELYPKDCQNAKEFYIQHKSLFETAAGNTGLSPQFLFAIVAPELTQFSYLSNKLETYSLKVLYVQGGKSYSNFSIGYFQMKPSFVELLENAATKDTALKAKYATCLFDNSNERVARATRIDRLNTVEWQIIYLSLFCEILQKRFNNISFATTEDRLRFYASAYNCGFHKSEQQIKETEQKALFPHFSRQKFRYSDIAFWFYLQNR